jgi:hypothetical protein
MGFHRRSLLATDPPAQIPLEELRYLRQAVMRTGIPETLLIAVAVRSLAGLGRKEIANLVRLYLDLPIGVRPTEVEV